MSGKYKLSCRARCRYCITCLGRRLFQHHYRIYINLHRLSGPRRCRCIMGKAASYVGLDYSRAIFQMGLLSFFHLLFLCPICPYSAKVAAKLRPKNGRCKTLPALLAHFFISHFSPIPFCWCYGRVHLYAFCLQALLQYFFSILRLFILALKLRSHTGQARHSLLLFASKFLINKR